MTERRDESQGAEHVAPIPDQGDEDHAAAVAQTVTALTVALAPLFERLIAKALRDFERRRDRSHG